jgi:hypothetical protein
MDLHGILRSVLSIRQCPCDSRETGKELLGEGVDRVSSRLCDDLAATRGNVEAEEVFNRL